MVIAPRPATARAAGPRRALIVSGTVGEGHNAAGRAIAEAIGRLWPHCEVCWADACEVMGPGAGPLFRAAYVFNVERTPWLYEFFYQALWRQRWFAEASKRFSGSWAGRRLAPLLAAHSPDLIVSTFPFGSAGLSWLRRHRGLAVPTGAWVPDFCPHPFWVYRNLDMTCVMHERATGVAAAADPGARVTVGGLPVSSAFAPRDRDVARKALGLPAGRFAVLVSAGSFGFGSVERGVSALLDADPRVHVTVACGRNKRLRRRLAARGSRTGGGRLTALGWAGDMADQIAAADVVVSNAGGMTALEAIACGRPVVMFDPIAAHGRANAELMAGAGVAVLCRTAADLRATVSALAKDPGALAPLRQRAAEAAGAGRAPDDDLRELAACRGLTRTGPVPLRAEDALFLHAQTDMLCQQVGALLLLEAATRDLRSGDLRAAVQARIRDVPELRRKLEPARSRWLRPCWVSDDDIDMERRVGEVVLGEGGAPATLDGLVGAFFSVPSDPQRTPWEVLLVRGVPGGRTAVVVKVHHTLGDSNAIIAALSKLFDREGRDREAGRLTSAHGDGARAAGAGNGGAAGMPGTGEQSPQDAGSCGARDPGSRARRGVTRRGAGMRVLAGARQAARTMRGLGHLAAAGFAPASPLNGPLTSPRRRYVPVTLPSRAVASTARALDARMADLLLAVVAEALSRLLRSRGERTEGCTLRAAVPRAVRNAPARRLGNRSAAVALDLPIGPMGPRDRLWAVRAQMEAHLRWGEAEAAAFVMRSLNILPPPLQRLVARQVYQRRFFNLLVSVFPGTRRQHRVLGARIVEVYPVLALADGVGLAIGAMTWGRSMSIGILADAALVGDVDLLADYITAAFGDFQAAGQRAVG